MKPIARFCLVAGGYVAALLLAWVAVAIAGADSTSAAAQASSGMSAFGDAILFLGVFGIAAVVPTGAALFFLRHHRHFWKLLVLLGLALGLLLALVVLGAAIVLASSTPS
jgi:hypothetical protein